MRPSTLARRSSAASRDGTAGLSFPRWWAGTCVVAMVAALTAVLAPAAYAVTPTCGAGSLTVTRISSPILYLDLGTTPKIDSAYEGFAVTNTSGSAYADVWVQAEVPGTPAIHLAPHGNVPVHLGAMANGATSYAYFYMQADAVSAALTHQVVAYPTRPTVGATGICTQAVSLSAAGDIAAGVNTVSTVVSGPTPPQLGGIVTITVTGTTGTIGNAGNFATSPASYSAWPADAFQLVGTKIQMTGGNTRTDTNTLFLTGLNGPTTDYVNTFTFVAVGTTIAPAVVSPMSHISSGTQMKHTTIDSTFTSLAPIASPVNNTTLALGVSPASLSYTGGIAHYTVTLSNASATATSLDDIVVTLPTAPATPTYVAATTKFNGVTSAAPAVSGSTLTFTGSYGVPANGSSTLTFDVAAPAISGLYASSAIGHILATRIDTTADSTDVAATASFTVAPQPPTVSAVARG